MAILVHWDGWVYLYKHLGSMYQIYEFGISRVTNNVSTNNDIQKSCHTCLHTTTTYSKFIQHGLRDGCNFARFDLHVYKVDSCECTHQLWYAIKIYRSQFMSWVMHSWSISMSYYPYSE